MADACDACIDLKHTNKKVIGRNMKVKILAGIEM